MASTADLLRPFANPHGAVAQLMRAGGGSPQPIAQGAAPVNENAIRAAERERIAAILGSPEAKGREASAQHLAFRSDMTVAEARGVLASSSMSGSGDHSAGGLDAGSIYASRRAAMGGQAPAAGDGLDPAAVYANRRQDR